jgi:hypothetical protein
VILAVFALRCPVAFNFVVEGHCLRPPQIVRLCQIIWQAGRPRPHSLAIQLSLGYTSNQPTQLSQDTYRIRYLTCVCVCVCVCVCILLWPCTLRVWAVTMRQLCTFCYPPPAPVQKPTMRPAYRLSNAILNTGKKEKRYANVCCM